MKLLPGRINLHIGVIILACIHNLSFAQVKYADNWYFAQYKSVTFASGTIVIQSPSSFAAPEGGASISDKNTGQLLFYTDGVSV